MRLLPRFAALLCVMIACGCGSGGSPPAKVYPVEGTLKFKGKPIAGADITFFNKEANRSAFGRTNDKGEYQLTTFSSNDGAVEGKNIVTISKFDAPQAATEVAPVESEAYVPPGFNQSTSPVKASTEFPAKYSSQETSGLIAVVSPDAPNTIDFDLKD